MRCEKCGEGGRQPVITSLFEYKYSDSSPFSSSPRQISTFGRGHSCLIQTQNVLTLTFTCLSLTKIIQTSCIRCKPSVGHGRQMVHDKFPVCDDLWREHIADTFWPLVIKGKVLNLPKTLKLNNDASSGWVYILWGSWIFTLKFMECLSVRKGED